MNSSEDSFRAKLAEFEPPTKLPPSFAVLHERKLTSEERTPLMHKMTEPLRSDRYKTGFQHVLRTAHGKYYAYYKGLNTGLQPTAMLAAYELMKIAKIKKVTVVEPTRSDYYPEYFIETPSHIDLAQIEQFRNPAVIAGWQGINVRGSKGNRRFTCHLVIDGYACRSRPKNTPVEAVWDAYLGRGGKSAVAKQKPDVDAEFVDLSVIEYLREGSGYRHVRKIGAKYAGRFFVKGVPVATNQYNIIEQAAWVVHHHLLDYPEIDSIDATREAAARRDNSVRVRSRVRAEYRQLKTTMRLA